MGIGCRMNQFEDRKIITILGSTKYRNEIKEYAWRLTTCGWLVLSAPFAKEEIKNLEIYRDELEAQHFQKIRMADVIMVFDKDNYIGESTKLEIEYAKNEQFNILYYSELGGMIPIPFGVE